MAIKKPGTEGGGITKETPPKEETGRTTRVIGPEDAVTQVFFRPGSLVKVRRSPREIPGSTERTPGEVEDGWRVLHSTPEGMVVVVKDDPDNPGEQLRKVVRKEELWELNRRGTSDIL